MALPPRTGKKVIWDDLKPSDYAKSVRHSPETYTRDKRMYGPGVRREWAKFRQWYAKEEGCAVCGKFKITGCEALWHPLHISGPDKKATTLHMVWIHPKEQHVSAGSPGAYIAKSKDGFPAIQQCLPLVTFLCMQCSQARRQGKWSDTREDDLRPLDPEAYVHFITAILGKETNGEV